MKKVFSVILAVLLIALCVPVAVGATIVNSGTCGDNLTWTLDDEGTLTISGTGEMETSWNNCPWDDYRASIRNVIINNGVTSIGDRAFTTCGSLTGIEMPNSVTSIGERAFNLCRSLTSVEIPDGVTSIGERAFFGCHSLASLEIPASVTNIGFVAFTDCDGITGITVNSDNLYYSSVDGVLFNKNKTIIICCPAGKTESFYIIPDGVVGIGDGAFAHCNSLTDIEIPNSVTSIGNSAFAECNGLTSVEIPNSVTSLGRDVFADCNNLAEIEIPNSVTSIGSGAFAGCNSLESVEIPAGVSQIEIFTFVNCRSLRNLKIRNPECVFAAEASFTFEFGISIWGYNGSTAQRIANDNNQTFYAFVEEVTLPASETVIKGELKTVNATVLPDNSGNKTVHWTSSDTTVASVDENGIVTGINPGTATITATSDEDDTLSASCVLTVVKSPADIMRLAGASRVDTSLEVAGEGWDSADTVILTNGYNFADALAGVPLSYALDAPILLTANSAELEQSVIDKINALGATKVIILGGVGAVNETIEATLEAQFDVERVFGASRFDTAVAIAEKLAEINGEYSDSAFIAYGYNYPDALAASSVASISSTPILFAKADGSFTESTENYISNHNVQNATILGGVGAVGADAETNLAALGASNINRVFGTSRYDTAFAIVSKYADLFTGTDIVLATGASFPDALAGGAFAAKIKAPVILVHPTQIPDGVLEYIANKNPATVYVLGGTGAVADSTVATFISLID